MLSTDESRKEAMQLKMMPSYSSVSYTESSSVSSDLRKDNGLNITSQLSEISHKKSKYVAIWTKEEVS